MDIFYDFLSTLLTLTIILGPAIISHICDKKKT